MKRWQIFKRLQFVTDCMSSLDGRVTQLECDHRRTELKYSYRQPQSTYWEECSICGKLIGDEYMTKEEWDLKKLQRLMDEYDELLDEFTKV